MCEWASVHAHDKCPWELVEHKRGRISLGGEREHLVRALIRGHPERGAEGGRKGSVEGLLLLEVSLPQTSTCSQGARGLELGPLQAEKGFIHTPPAILSQRIIGRYKEKVIIA